MMQVEQTADSAEDFGHLIDVLCNLVEYETGCLPISHGVHSLGRGGQSLVKILEGPTAD
jgi:hypothetical protein